MNERHVTVEDRARDAEQCGVWPSITLTLGITAVTWIAIATVFALGYAAIALFGGVGGGISGLAVWVLIWIAMWAATTLAIGSGLAVAFRAWVALVAPLSRRDQPRRTGAPAGTSTDDSRAEDHSDDSVDRVKRMAVEEAEYLLRHKDDR
jgi:hypothetical protein